MPRHRWARKIFWTGLTLLLVGLLAPFVATVNFWHGRIVAALSRELGRPVRAGAIHLKLFGGPGFEINNVVVEEDPRFGIEPLARMETLRATIGLNSLLQKRMQFSSLVFVHPSLNVVRNAEGQWNLESLWRVQWEGNREPGRGYRSQESGIRSPQSESEPRPEGSGAGGEAGKREQGTGIREQGLPRIQIEAGRINFKSENRKKVYLIDTLDMEMAPPSSSSEPWRLSFEGRPNRTDSSLNPVSRFRGQAEFGPFSPDIQTEAGTLARLDLTAENALVEDLLKISTGNDYGVHGSLNLHLHLAGTTSLLRLSGSADLRDLHRWDRLPAPAASVLHAEISAILDLERESFELRSVSIPLSKGTVVVQGEIEQLFHHPVPDLRAQLREVSLADIVEIAKQFTTRLDTRFIAQGKLDGRFQMEGSPDTLTGTLSVTEAMLQEKGTPQMARLSDFRAVFDGTSGRAGPLMVNLGDGGQLGSAVEWDFGKRELTVHLEGDAVRLDSFLPWAKALGSRWGQANFARGNLALRVSVASWEGKQSKIIGWAQISDALLNSAAVNQPIQVPMARLQFQPGKVSVTPFSAELGPLELHGSFVAQLPPPESPAMASARHFPTIDFDLQASKIDIGDLDHLLNPRYRPAPFFRFQGGGDRSSPFFAGLVARGAFQAGLLSYRANAIKNFKTSMDFHDRTLEIKSFTGEFAGGTQNGKATIRFGLGAPAFSLQSRFSNVDLNQLTKVSPSWSGFFSGKLRGNLRLAGSGWDLHEILDHLGGSGEATGVNLELNGINLTRSLESESEPLTLINSLSSTFLITKRQVLITDLKMVPVARPARVDQRAPILIVTGAVGFDRTLDLVVTEKGGGPPYHWGGTLAEPLVGETAALLRSMSHPAPE